jgi:hypothetical protein
MTIEFTVKSNIRSQPAFKNPVNMIRCSDKLPLAGVLDNPTLISCGQCPVPIELFLVGCTLIPLRPLHPLIPQSQHGAAKAKLITTRFDGLIPGSFIPFIKHTTNPGVYPQGDLLPDTATREIGLYQLFVENLCAMLTGCMRNVKHWPIIPDSPGPNTMYMFAI